MSLLWKFPKKLDIHLDTSMSNYKSTIQLKLSLRPCRPHKSKKNFKNNCTKKNNFKTKLFNLQKKLI